MTGTEKQIKWAEDIKASAIEAFDIMESNTQIPYFSEYSLEAVKAIRAFAEPQILAMEDAAVIIKNRARLTQRAFEDQERSDAKNCRRFVLKLTRSTDADIIALLENKENKQEGNKMITLLKTADKALADSCERNAQKEFGVFSIYRFQYRANDDKVYYEILLKDN